VGYGGFAVRKDVISGVVQSKGWQYFSKKVMSELRSSIMNNTFFLFPHNLSLEHPQPVPPKAGSVASNSLRQLKKYPEI
jgi:hypothetical protein